MDPTQLLRLGDPEEPLPVLLDEGEAEPVRVAARAGDGGDDELVPLVYTPEGARHDPAQVRVHGTGGGALHEVPQALKGRGRGAPLAELASEEGVNLNLTPLGGQNPRRVVDAWLRLDDDVVSVEIPRGDRLRHALWRV
jgi:hypothetical protein